MIRRPLWGKAGSTGTPAVIRKDSAVKNYTRADNLINGKFSAFWNKADASAMRIRLSKHRKTMVSCTELKDAFLTRYAQTVVGKYA